MKEELWLKKLRERLDNYSEPLPSGGWERLEQALRHAPAMPARRPRLPRLLAAAAAAGLLLVLSSVGVWLLHSPAALELRDTPLPPLALNPAVPPESTPHTPRPDTSAPAHGDLTPAGRADLTAQLTAPRPRPEQTFPAGEDALPLPAVPEADTAGRDSAAAPSPVTPAGNGQEPALRPRPARNVPPARPAAKQRRHRPEGWSVGISVGNTGGATSRIPGMSVQNPLIGTGSPYGNKVDLPSASSGIVTIPEGRELVFKGGIPYLLARDEQVVSVDHKQPVTVGLSVRKALPRGFSLETGLTYTLLASDLRYEGSADIARQKLHYVGIPLRAGWDFLHTKTFAVYVSAGGAAEKCVYGTVGGEKETVTPLQFSVSGGLGAQLNLTRHLGLYVEPGVSYFFDDTSGIQTIRKENPCSFTLRAGFRLSY